MANRGLPCNIAPRNNKSEAAHQTPCLSEQPPGEHIQAKRGTLCCLDCDTEEGADETDEGGGKRLLRSHTAAAAADLDRENSVHYTMGSI